ncbi:MAG: hypothetical protein ACE5MG_10600 [Candidatus Methylomirabilales bacterium]
MVLLIAGIVGALFWSIQIGILTSVVGLLADVIALLLYRQLKQLREDANRLRKDIAKACDKAVERFMLQAEGSPNQSIHPTGNDGRTTG